uniref:Phosphoglycerate mutase (2,3-diphosphoglycerate-dependent) n=1 Tax=Chaetoceros debilis TaxID=122233 RepID=A0A7S3QIR9_9STRA
MLSQTSRGKWLLTAAFDCKAKAMRQNCNRFTKHFHLNLSRPMVSVTSKKEDAPKKGTCIQRPTRIILIRHGESLGNVDDSAYVATPDWKVPLTERGRQQSFDAGKELADIVGDGQVFFYYSPYKRTRATVDELLKHINKSQIISTREEPRISEQQFGNFQNVEQVWESKKERHEFGRFYYRFKSGEAGLDVYSRVSSFISTLVRDCQQYQKAGYELDTVNVVIVTHGLSLRLFLMRWFQFGVEEFEATKNPDNAALVVMKKRCPPGGHRWYELDEKNREELNLPEWCNVPKNVHLHSLLADARLEGPS